MGSFVNLVFEHIGAARLYNGSVRIDVKTMQAVIPASGIQKLLQHWNADIFDISDVVKSANAEPVGTAWLSRSGKAVIYRVNGARYTSSLAQFTEMLDGKRKYAGVALMIEAGTPISSNAAGEGAAAGVLV